jgi:hypothetical protein
MATARGPIPNHPERRIAVPAGSRAAGTIALALIAALIGWLVHTPGTETVTRTVPNLPATIYQDTPAGAIAAVQTYFSQTEQQQPLPPAPPNRPGKMGEEWQLRWRMQSYTPSKALVQTWGVAFEGGFGSSGQTWAFNDVPVSWQGGRWFAGEPPTSWSNGRRLVTIDPHSATPPADNTQGAEDAAFGRLLWTLRRFPSAP